MPDNVLPKDEAANTAIATPVAAPTAASGNTRACIFICCPCGVRLPIEGPDGGSSLGIGKTILRFQAACAPHCIQCGQLPADPQRDAKRHHIHRYRDGVVDILLEQSVDEHVGEVASERAEGRSSGCGIQTLCFLG